jgi:eukaryotic-like serine/threonine-protein kinase
VTSDQPVSSDALPRRFGRYVLFDKIGEGGMARIYLGRTATGLGGERLAVVKQILPLLSGSAEFSRLLIEEAKLAAQLSHGSVVQVFDLGREQDALYIAMEYVEGFDLRELLRHCTKHKVPLPVEFAFLIVVETLRALDYAHRKRDDAGRSLGVVHRDVSPSNVLISFDGEVKLCDFGIARAMGAEAELPEAAIQGKAGYMSPEAARGETPDARSDVFAVGIILWELLAGKRLYRGSNGRAPPLELARQAEIPSLPLRGYLEEERLHSIVHRALARDRSERYATARDMLRELEAYVSSSALLASPLRLGQWLMDNFGGEILQRRRARERAARLLDAEAPPESERAAKPVPAASAEPEPMSLEGIAHTMRSPSAASEQKRRSGWLVIVLIVLALLALALGFSLRR